MELTEERVIPKLMKSSNQLLAEHIARYEFATQYARGRVLDMACGVGYGLPIVKKKAGNAVDELIGVDVHRESIAYAIENYWQPKMDFLEGDCLDLSLKDKIGQFDTIISMETIEHLEDDQRFIDNLVSLIKPGGIVIISTPFGRGRGKPCSNLFHFHQYREEEFMELLKPLGQLEMFYQLDTIIEKRQKNIKYYLMVAVCKI